MKASSDNLYNLIKKSKAEVISVKVKYKSMPEEISYLSTYEFTKCLKHLVKSNIFDTIDWYFDTSSCDSLVLASNAFECMFGTYVEVEIAPFGNTTMQQITQELAKTILTI